MAVKELNFRLGEIRTDCDLSLSDVARLTKTSRQTICNYEKGNYKPSMSFYIKFYKAMKKRIPSLNFMYLIDSECEDKFAINQDTLIEFGLSDKCLNNLKELTLVNGKYNLTSSTKKPKIQSSYSSTINLFLGNNYFVQFIKNLHELLEHQTEFDSEYFNWLLSKEINNMSNQLISNLQKK